MYFYILSDKEQDQVVRGLKGWQWVRENHGSLYDRGSADSYYDRAPDPHYGGVGGDSGERVAVKDAGSVEEYLAGYTWNELHGHKKSWD
jgi:hypothetical protein